MGTVMEFGEQPETAADEAVPGLDQDEPADEEDPPASDGVLDLTDTNKPALRFYANLADL